MEKFSKVVIAVDFFNNSFNLLSSIHRMDFLANSEIHFVHFVPEVSYGDGLSVAVMFPDGEQQVGIREAVLSKMKSASSEILPYSHNNKVFYECFFSADYKDSFCNYLKKVQADLVIIATRERKGVFASSFAYYVALHSPTTTLILKQPKKDYHEARFKGKMKVLVGLKLNQDLETLKGLKKLSFIKYADIRMLHLSTLAQNDFFSKFNFPPYPVVEAQVVIRESVEKYVEERKNQLLPEDFSGTFKVECEFSTHPRKTFCENAENEDLVVLVPEDKPHFLGSFIHYQLIHGHSNLLLLKS